MKKSQSEIIKEHIEHLNASGSSNWQRLFGQVDGQYNTLQYNVAQMATSLAIQRYKTVLNLWGRGTGKTTSIGDTIRQMRDSMPRAVGAFVSPSYQFFLTRIIPSLVAGLEMQGIYQGLHYFIGRKPPASWNWPLPYQPPSKWDHFVIFHNGFGFHLVSQDVAGDGRGLNLDFILTDESGLLDKLKLEETVEPALRGSNRSAFGKSCFFGSTIHHSSMPLTRKGQWLFSLEQAQFEHPDAVKCILANATINAHNLMPGYLEERKKTTTPWVFDAEYMNKRPKKVDNSFYALLDEDQHGYSNYDYTYYNAIGKAQDSRGDADVVKDKPLQAGIDWGAVINSMVIGQLLPGEFRALKSLYTLGDKGETQDDLADEFIKYYHHHPTKLLYLYYDNTGNNRTGNTKVTRAQQFIKRLHAAGWRVIPLTEGGANVKHEAKHMIWEALLRESDTRLPAFRINTVNARDLLISMQNTQVINTATGFKKDKSSERKLRSGDRHLATDLSDAIDTLIYPLFRTKVHQSGGSLPSSRIG